MAIEQLNYCNRCGTALVGLPNFCTQCGQPLHPGASGRPRLVSARPPAPGRPAPARPGQPVAPARFAEAPPSLGLRAGAAALDAALMGVGSLLALTLGTRLSVIALAGSPVHGASPLGLVGVALVLACYHPFCWARSGQTPGMRLAGITLTQRNGAPVTLGQAVVREIALLGSLLAFGTGFLAARSGPGLRTWHDRRAGTELRSNARPSVRAGARATAPTRG